MKFKILKWILLGPLIILALVYIAGAIRLATDDRTVPTLDADRSAHQTVTIFGASGTAGDGIPRPHWLIRISVQMLYICHQRVNERSALGEGAYFNQQAALLIVSDGYRSCSTAFTPGCFQPGFDGLLARAWIDAANGFKFVAYLLTYRHEFDFKGLEKRVRVIFEYIVLAKLLTHMSRKSVSGAIALTNNYPVTSQITAYVFCSTITAY